MQAITRSFPPHALVGSPARLLALRANRTHRHPALPLEALHPAHGGGWFVRVNLAAGLGWHDAGPVFEVGCEHTRDGFAPLLLTRCVRRALALACAVNAGQVQTWARDQGGEAGDKVQRFQHHMGHSSRTRSSRLSPSPMPVQTWQQVLYSTYPRTRRYTFCVLT